MSSWPDRDNKNIRGPRDSRYVSFTEPWERDHFIVEYLKSRNYGLTEENRKQVSEDLKQCRLRSPALRSEVAAWLDDLYRRRS